MPYSDDDISALLDVDETVFEDLPEEIKERLKVLRQTSAEGVVSKAHNAPVPNATTSVPQPPPEIPNAQPDSIYEENESPTKRRKQLPK